MPTLITDLALILAVAGIVTILFKRLKQPLVLGYIVAGFLAGPHMPYMPTVSDMESVETWSQIGVIFLMFSLGLEFSFKKIVKMGISPVICAMCIMICMISIGNGVGWLFGWSSMNRLFLGGMLAMSSTTIIYKAFDDLGLRQKKFTKGVMSVLILEDILGILLMVVLSALAVSKQFEGSALVMSLLKLGFFLALWFIVGIFIIPIFLKKNSKYINSETLLIVSIGLCFLLVMLADKAGYSPAFGAFMMGSILAETVEAERIESAISSVKDLFGAIFFVSVGMLVNPNVLLQYWLPILVIVIAILLGQSIFGTLSFILSGQNLKGGMQSGFSMAQIGEFAFIIAGLGISLGVTDRFLYPVVVAVSIITTFLTPYMIKAAVPAYNWADRVLPEKVKNFLGHETNEPKLDKNAKDSKTSIPLAWMVGGDPGYSFIDKQAILSNRGTKKVWKSLLQQLISQTAAYMILTIAAITFSFASVLPVCRHVFTHWPGNIICGLITLAVVSLFLRPIVMRKNRSDEFIYLAKQGFQHRFLLWMTMLLRFGLATWGVYRIFDYLSPYKWWLHIILSMLVVVGIIFSRRVKYFSIKMERTFRHNLSRRDRLTLQNDRSAYARKLYGRDIHIASLMVPETSMWAGRSLAELKFSKENNIIVVAIVRGDYRINIPDATDKIFPRDIIEVVGDDESIEELSKLMQIQVHERKKTHKSLHIKRIVLSANNSLIGKTISESDIRSKMNCIVIGIEMQDGSLSIATADHKFSQGDIIWVVG